MEQAVTIVTARIASSTLLLILCRILSPLLSIHADARCLCVHYNIEPTRNHALQPLIRLLSEGLVIVHSVSSNTLRDVQIWGILPHIALAASGFSCFHHENASRYSGLCTVRRNFSLTNNRSVLQKNSTLPNL